MKKKILVMVLALTMSVTTFAQFAKGTSYASAGLTGASLNYTGSEKWRCDVGAKLGYLLDDCWMALVQGEFNYRRYQPNELTLGIGVRYYIIDNGIFLGGGVNYQHRPGVEGSCIDDFMPTVHIGYAHFLSRSVTIEPEVYYNQSFKKHEDYSGLGFRLNFGIYLEDLF